MKKTDLRRRIDNSIEAFFRDPEDASGAGGLSLVGETSLRRQEAESDLNKRAGVLTKVLRRIFLFLPGAFFLYFASLFLLYACFVTGLDILGFGPGFVGLVVSSFMTVVGIGSVKDSKHLTIPASIFACSLLVFMVSLLLPAGPTRATFLFEYSAYLFPFVLLTAFGVRRWVEKLDGEDSDYLAGRASM